MRRTSGARLHAHLAMLVAACAAGCSGQALTSDDEAVGGSGGSGGGSGSKATSSGGKASDGVPNSESTATGGSEPLIEGGAAPEGGSSAAGAGGSEPAPVDDLVCSGTAPSLVAGWQTDPALDYVALRLQTGLEELGPPMIEQEWGTPCSGVSEPEVCAAALANTLPDVTFNRSAQLRAEYHFAYTRGDAVGVIGTTLDLKNVLGTIDTGNEAAAMWWAANRQVRCDDIKVDRNGYVASSTKMLSDCPVTYQPVEVRVAHDGTVSETEVGQQVVTGACAGRRPPGFCATNSVKGQSPVGEWLARVAELELASIEAFARLEQELQAHGAPVGLQRRCRAACADEARHARAVAELARAFGAEPGSVVAAPRSVRSLLELALDNAREGAVRELYGAAVAAWQAHHARDARVRAVFATIAREEAEHAALAFDLASWLEPQLDAVERAQVEAESRRSWGELRAELARPASTDVERQLGVPAPLAALALLDALERTRLAA